jgi:hypothetical protein|tara:strand:+ start:143 stop:448 length:306 start_codon:yes stop_codon:yes gene_type:complete
MGAASTGQLEEGFANFDAGQSFQDVILQLVRRPANINATIVELPDTYNTGSDYNSPANRNIDIPSRAHGTIQVAAYWLSDTKFRITTSAPFYGHVRWLVTS